MIEVEIEVNLNYHLEHLCVKYCFMHWSITITVYVGIVMEFIC